MSDSTTEGNEETSQTEDSVTDSHGNSADHQETSPNEESTAADGAAPTENTAAEGDHDDQGDGAADVLDVEPSQTSLARFVRNLLLDLLVANVVLFELWKEGFMGGFSPSSPVWTPIGPWLFFRCRRWLEEKIADIPIYRPLERFRLVNPNAKVVWIVVDALAMNVLMFLLVRMAVFMPSGITTLFDTVLCAVAILWLLWFSQGILPWRDKPSPQTLIDQSVFFGTFVCVIYVLNTLEATFKGRDFSWIRVETVKTPHWVYMLGGVSPIYSTVFITVSLALVYWIVRHPRTPWRYVLPLGLATYSLWLIHDIFSYFWITNEWLYRIGMVGPPLLCALFLLFQRYAMGLRSMPFVYYATLLLLNYTGVVPIQGDKEALLAPAPQEVSSDSAPLAKRLYPAPQEAPDPSILFMRKLVKIDKHLYTSFGPTCGIYRFNIDEPNRDHTVLNGLVRDISVGPDNKSIWGINWMQGDFFSVDATTMKMNFEYDLFEFDLRVPYRMEVRGDTAFITSTTPPALGVVEVNPNAKGRERLSLKRRVDFQQIGYIPFSDGAYGVYVDEAHERIYVLVGFLEGKFLLGLVELDYHTLELLRDVRMTAGMDLYPVAGRRTVLIPSYYTDELHEVDLDSMTVLRTMEAGPNLVELQYDAKRKLIYGVSRTSGVLQIIDYGSGEVVREIPTGPKPEPLLVDTDRDVLYVGSGGGIFELPLDRLTEGL